MGVVLTQDKFQPPPPSLGRVHYPFWGSENCSCTALLSNKATFWDGEGILQQSRTVFISRNVTFSVPKQPGALAPVPTTKQWAWNIQLYQTDPAFPTQTDFPSPGPESVSATNIWISHTSNCSLLPLSCSKENEWFKCTFEMNFICKETDPGITHFMIV